MDGRQDNVTGFLVHELQNTFSQVAFDGFDTLFFQKFVQFAFFSQHGFAFDEMFDIVFFQNAVYDLSILFCILGPVDNGTVGLGVSFELQEQFVEMTVTVLFDGAGHIAQMLPFGNRAAESVTFGTYHP